MSTLLLSALALPPLALAIWWFRRAAAPQPAPAADRARHHPASPAAKEPRHEPLADAAPAAAMPPALACFEWRTADQLDADKLDRLLAAIQDIPRPSHALQQLLSPEFLTKASSGELRELVMGEPLIVAQVVATVNSPFHGLRTPVTDIGQAVTFLGITRVRNICLQHLLAETLQPKLPGVRKAFNALWTASAIASELAVRLDKAMGTPAQTPLATMVLLGFVGQLATASLIPLTGLSAWLQRDRLTRARLEQDLLGLNAGEIGHLLMQRWGLPAALVADVRDTGRLLVTPPQQIEPERLPRLAQAYLCTRLGERLALGHMDSLDGYRPADDDAVDIHHLRACAAHPALARLDEVLQSPGLREALRRVPPPA